MSDFDFDELDRAVNSLNNTDNNQAQGQKDKPQVTVNEDRPIPSLAARRTPGPFMDVMHPSSNMMRNANQPARVNNSSPASDLINQNSTIVESEPVKEGPALVNLDTRNEVKLNNEEDEDINKISEDINKTLGLTNESPFITDAQVEKRPLGAFSGESDENTLGNDAMNNAPESLPAISDTPLPAELDNDLLSIEANSVAKSTVPEGIEQSIVAETIQAETPQNEQEKLDDTKESIAPVVSIPKQYAEKTSSKPESDPIYNNKETYKQTLVPAKKKTGWLWVVWILLLILIGAGVGAAVYFFVLEP